MKLRIQFMLFVPCPTVSITYCQHNQTIGMFSSSSTDPTLEECWPRIL